VVLLFVFTGASLSGLQHKSKLCRYSAALEGMRYQGLISDMTVRPATDSDRTALFDLHRAVFHGHIEKIWGWGESWQRSNFAAEFAYATTSVIEVDGQTVGYFQVLDKDDLNPYSEHRGFTRISSQGYRHPDSEGTPAESRSPPCKPFEMEVISCSNVTNWCRS
jgi:hypothetical protein